MSQRIQREDEGGLCTLTLSRPDKLNALDTLAFEELDAHLAALEGSTDTVGCVVLRGEGRGFCAGADLRAMNEGPITPEFKSGVITRLASLPQPTIAAIHGVCYTGGLELALGCDFLVADSTARFCDTHGKWGLVANWGMIQRLPLRVGEAAAKRMMLTACSVGAAEANQLGLVDVVTDQGRLGDIVSGLAREILANSWHTNFSVKRLMRETQGMSTTQAVLYAHQHHPGFAPDYKQRIAAFTRSHASTTPSPPPATAP